MTYTLIIGVVLCVVAVAFIFYILQNPTIDQQLYNRLEQTADLVVRQRIIYSTVQEGLSNTIQRIDAQGNVRVLILSPQKDIILDSSWNSGDFSKIKIQDIDQLQRGIVMDSTNDSWLFVWRSLDDGGYLVLAIPRIRRVALLFTDRLQEVLRDELLPVLVRSGLIALFISLILALWMSNWIATPLKRIVEAMQHLPRGKQSYVPTKGPKEVQYLASTYNDMTNQVIASQESQKDFVVNVSHELKTPLTSIQGYAQAILDGTVESTEDIKQAAQIIHAEAGRIHRLVLNLLDLAKLETRTTKMNYVRVDINKLLQQLVARFLPQAERAEVQLSYNKTKLPDVAGDEERLIQAFSNLVDNAIKFTPKKGEVKLSAYRDEKNIVVEVNDTGIGIKPEDKLRIFERFYQVEKSRSGTIERGVGLGLPIASEIVKAHGGEIIVASKPTQGSNFMVKLPLASAQDLVIKG